MFLGPASHSTGQWGGLTPPSTLQSIPRNAPERIAVLDPDLVVFYLGDGFGCGKILNQGSGGLESPTVSPAVPSPASGSFRQPLEAMKEKEVHPKQVKVMGGGSRARCADGLHLWPTLIVPVASKCCMRIILCSESSASALSYLYASCEECTDPNTSFSMRTALGSRLPLRSASLGRT